MSVKLKFKIGGMLLEVTGAHEEDVIKEASFWNELPTECGLCQSKNIGFRFRTAKDYDFYECRCKDCRATYALGQKKEGGLYPRGSQEKGQEGEWEKEYVRDGGGRDDRNDSRDDRNDSRDQRGRGDDRRGRQEPATRDQGRGRGNDSGERGRQQDTRHPAPKGGQTRSTTSDLDDDDVPF